MYDIGGMPGGGTGIPGTIGGRPGKDIVDYEWALSSLLLHRLASNFWKVMEITV
jgi:hypothetical protein